MRFTWLVPAAAALTATLLVIVLEGFSSAVLAQALVLVAVIVLVMAVGTLWGRDRNIPLFCDPFFLMCLFLAQFYVIGPFAAEFVEIFSVPFMYKYAPERTIQALLAFLAFLAAAVVGHKLNAGTQLATLLPDFRSARRRLSGRWIEALLIGGGVLGCVGWVAFNGGLVAKMSSGYGQWKAGGALFRIAFVAVQSGTLLLAWRVVGARRPSVATKWLLAGVLLFQVGFFGILIGMRKYLLFMFFGLLTVWVLRRGVAALPKLRLAVAAVILLLFFSFWGTIRSRPLADLIEGNMTPMYGKQSAFYEGYLEGVGGPFSVACLVFELFPEPEHFKHGSTLLVTVLGFVPRAVWPDKPIGIGKEITKYIMGPFYEPVYGFSVTVTLPADLYLNFGWFGIVLGGLFAGIVCRAATAYAVCGSRDGRQTSASRVVLSAAFVMGLGEVRADMAMMLATYALMFIPLLFAFTFFRIDLPESEAL